MSERLISLKESVTAATMLGVLGVTGCGGESINERVMGGMDCGENPDATVSTTYYNLSPGEVINIGNPDANVDGLITDAAVSISDEGQLTAAAADENHRDAPEVQNADDAMRLITGDETYDITAAASTDGDGFDVIINGHCTPQD